MSATKYKQHPLAKAVPAMSEKEFGDLVVDLKKNGLQQDIVLYEGMVLDGWNRYNGCLKGDVEPRFKEYKGDTPLAFVTSMLTRRNLTSSQLATYAAEMAEKLAEEAKALQPDPETEKAPESTGKVAARAAEAVGTSTRQVERAQQLKKKDPEKFKQVKAGKVSLSTATKPTPTQAQKKEQEVADAIKRIGKVCGMSLSNAVIKGVRLKSHAEILKFAALDDEDMLRIQNLVERDWKVGRALKYKMTALSAGHKIRDLLDRAAAQGGKFQLNIEGWHVEVKKV